MHTLNCKGTILGFKKPLVMGIINTTPDSFFAGSRHVGHASMLKQATEMIAAGASMIDIGGQSTRPGAEIITADEEINRVLPAIEMIHQTFAEVVLSVDTFYAQVAKAAVAAGASMVNDVSGGLADAEMLSTVAHLKTPFVCMHRANSPAAMGGDELTKNVLDFFIERLDACLQKGIKDVVVDVGFGFGKTPEQNLALLKNLAVFKMLQKPLLIGVSRKSTIYKTLGITANEALNGTTVLHTIGLLNGANMLRVHDVKEAMEAIQLVEKYKQGL